MKVQQVRVCLSCDEVYDGLQCPKCLEEKFVYLRTYFPHLSSITLKEVRDENTHPALQMVGKEESCGDVGNHIVIDERSKLFRRILDTINTNHKCRFTPHNLSEPSESTSCKGDHSGGVKVEPKGRIVKGCHRINAGIAFIWEAICRLFQDGTFLSRKEYHCGYENTCILSTDIADASGGTK